MLLMVLARRKLILPILGNIGVVFDTSKREEDFRIKSNSCCGIIVRISACCILNLVSS